VSQPLVFGINALRVCASPRRDWLHALALAVAEQADRVSRERCAPFVVAEHLPDSFEIPLKPLEPVAFQCVVHATIPRALAVRSKFLDSLLA
jgi:hypothetical protein